MAEIPTLYPDILKLKKKRHALNAQNAALFVDLFSKNSWFSWFSIDKNGRFGDKFGELFEIMGKLMNFTYRAIPSKDGQYGSKVFD